MAYFVIPVYTLLFTRGYSWLTMNFSVIGNLVDKKLAFFIWGLLVGGYFHMIFRRIGRRISLRPAAARLIPLALVLLFCAVTTPYLPEVLPLKAFLHIVFAFIATVLLLFYLLAVIWTGYSREPGRFRPYLFGLAAIAALSAYLLIRVGIVSSLLEFFITCSTVIMAERLVRQLEKISPGEIVSIE